MNGLSKEMWDSDYNVEKLINEYDETLMPLPDIELEPHLLISKVFYTILNVLPAMCVKDNMRVRKHYMNYLIKLLSLNYENNQRLLNKNIYLPSAIWRCAKNIETKAAQSSMLVQLYRKNIVSVIKDLKNDTNKGKLNKLLYENLHKPPKNEKNLQTPQNFSSECSCQCTCNSQKRRRKVIDPTKEIQNDIQLSAASDSLNGYAGQNGIPVIINSNIEYPKDYQTNMESHVPLPNQIQPIKKTTDLLNSSPPKQSICQESDELMLQLEKLFQDDPNDDDLFDTALCDTIDSTTYNENVKKQECFNKSDTEIVVQKQDILIENQAAQIKSLDERLESLTGLLVNNSDSNNFSQQKPEEIKPRKRNSSKWLCEEYFLKLRLFELLDQIRDGNRKKLARIQCMLLDLFGDDSDDEGVVSPLDETPEFITSCKERIAPWVVQMLTPYYIKGRIRGKALFKALAKHLIRLIYQCSRYPQEYEVNSFVADFLENHKMIRCEADFKQFRIENI